MQDIVTKVQCKIKITLSEGTEIDISLNNNQPASNNIENYITDISLNENLSAINNNPVGVVSSNVLKLTLNSNDRSLFPENTESKYYGLMNNSATVNITLTDEEGDIEFNTFYISNWYTSITSSSPYKVIIECTDLISILNKNIVPSGIITDNIDTKETFIYLINKLNEQLVDKYKIKYDSEDINFGDFKSIELDNLETYNMSDLLNTISQCTLTNIYIDRDNKIKTDYCLDDKKTESVCTLSDKINITSATIDTGGLVKYNTVKTNYIINTINSMSKLTTINNQKLTPGINTFNSLDLGNKTFRINTIVINTQVDDRIVLDKFEYDKRTCTVVINNTGISDVDCDIDIYGQSFKESTLSIIKSNGDSNELLEVTNRLILPKDAELYTTKLLSLVGIRNSSISVSGFFNPRIKLGDTVYVDVEKSINTKGYYKIISLQWKISNTVKCTAKLIKTIV